MKLSKRGTIDFSAVELEKASQIATDRGLDLVRMDAGVPHSLAPRDAINEAVNRVKFPKGYTETAGIPPLRKSIAKMYQDNYGVHIDSERICITMGASSAIILVLLAYFNDKDKIAVPLPCYGAHLDVIKSLNLETCLFHTSKENRYQPVPEELDALGNINGLFITNPGNPTGSMLSPERLHDIVLWCNKNKVTLIVDEVYHFITYGSVVQQTALKYAENLIVLNSFSKYYAMPGWRLGWVVLPPSMVESTVKLAHSLFVSPSNIAQHVALNVMEHTKELNDYVNVYKANQEVLLEEIPKLGFSEFTPMDGAFYLYVNIEQFGMDSMSFCKSMVHQAQVVGLPGTCFDPIKGQNSIRLSYSCNTEEVIEACKRLAGWLQ